MCVCQRAGFTLGCIHLCIGKETASTHSQRVGALLWVALAQFFFRWYVIGPYMDSTEFPLHPGGTSPHRVERMVCRKLGLPSSPPLALLELSGLDCRVSIVIGTLLCENHRGFPLSWNTGLWDPGHPERLLSTGQTEVLRAWLSLLAQVWG